MLFAVSGLKRLLLLFRQEHMGEYRQDKGKGVSFGAMKAYRESKLIPKILTSDLFQLPT
jgi:hypothetical protein